MATKSRAEYMKKYRESIGQAQLNVCISKEKLEKLNEVLSAKGISKKDWLSEKIDEEISE